MAINCFMPSPSLCLLCVLLFQIGGSMVTLMKLNLRMELQHAKIDCCYPNIVALLVSFEEPKYRMHLTKCTKGIVLVTSSVFRGLLLYIYGLVWERHNSIADALELCLSCTTSLRLTHILQCRSLVLKRLQINWSVYITTETPRSSSFVHISWDICYTIWYFLH